MVKFDSTRFGEVVINGRSYGDILLIEGKITSRNRDLLKKIYGISHVIGDQEVKDLLKGNPEVVIIGTGRGGSIPL